MNAVDVVSLAYVAFGAHRGRKHGLAVETYRLLRIGIAFVAGCGLYGLVSGWLGRFLSLGMDTAGPLCFVAIIGVTWWILRRFRQSFTGRIAARFQPHQAVGGAIAGALRRVIIILSIASALHLAGKAPGHSAVENSALVGDWVARVLPHR